MGISSNLLNAPKEFLSLFKAGKEAARKGQKTKAHELFRQAIAVDPYHEQVWLWLASVVETDEDRRVCFENVLELNPSNPTARQQLLRLDEKAINEILSPPRARRSTWQRLLLGLIAVAIVAGAIIAALMASGFL